MKHYLLLLSTLLLATSVFSQKNHSINFRTGMAAHSFQDNNFSAVPYSGIGLSYGLAYSKHSEKSLFSVDFDVQNAQLQSQLNEDLILIAALDRDSYTGTISYLRKVNTPRVDVYFGASSTTFYDLVPFPLPGNNQFSYELTNTFNAAIELSYSFNEKLNYRLKADIPTFSLSVRPQDGGLFHMKNLEFDIGRALKSAKFYPTNKIFSLHFHHVIEYQYKGRTFGLYYDYLGGYNKVVGKKGSAIQKVGITIPLFTKS
jgi:hypothetical protein